MSRKHANYSAADLSTTTGESNSNSALHYCGLTLPVPVFYSNEFIF